jgi:hypothetical protein
MITLYLCWYSVYVQNNNNHFGCSVSLNLSQFLHYMVDFVDIGMGSCGIIILTPHFCGIFPRYIDNLTRFVNESGGVCTKSKLPVG